MSTGVYRQYPTQRLTAPLLTLGQPLDSPIASAALARSYAQPGSIVRLIPLGIAALIPIAAGFVPPPAVASVARQPYPIQQLTPEVAQFLSPNTTDSLPAQGIARVAPVAATPFQWQPVEIAPLIPAAAAFVPPPAIASPTRSVYPTQELGAEVAPFLSPNTTDSPLAQGIVRIAPAVYASAQLQPVEIAPLIPSAATYIAPLPTANVARGTYPAQLLAPETFAPFLSPNTTDTVLASRVAAIQRDRAVQATVPQTGIAALLPTGVAYVPPMQQLSITRARATQQPMLSVRYTQPGIAPVIPDFIDSTRLLRVTFNGRVLAVDQLATTLKAQGQQNALSVGEIEDALSVDPQKRTVH